jgi:Glu-tRNA(Gln) amidotransferase subunit E-like FAD-binding protein
MFQSIKRVSYSRLAETRSMLELKGDITKDSNGNVSVQDMIRLFGSRQDKKATNNAVKDLLSELEHTEQDNSVQLSNTEQLLLIEIEQLKRLIEQLKKEA